MNFTDIYHVYSVKKIMFLVVIACIPGVFSKYYFFGSGTLIQILLSILTAILLEIIILKIRSKKIKITLEDNSSVLTAILFGVSVPAFLPWWIAMIGLFFSIVIAKHLYGGLGQNIFNPAMVGYAVLLIAFPIHMNNWQERDLSMSFQNDLKKAVCMIFAQNDTYTIDNTNTIGNDNVNIVPDAFTEATPLNNFKIKSHLKNDFLSKQSILKNKKITIQNSWKYINISFFLGGIFLLCTRIICWRIPISFLTSLGVLSMLTYCFSKDLFMSPLVHFFSGGTMICAFFISTDPVTTSCTNIGKIIFGIIIGILVWIIRNYSDYPDAIAFSVLFANMTVPFIDYYTKPSGYGHHNI